MALRGRQTARHGDYVPTGRIEEDGRPLRGRQNAWHVDYVQQGRIEDPRNRLRKRHKDLLKTILTRCEVDQPGCILVAHVLDG